MPAIFAIAYASFVSSSGPVSSASSRMGCGASFGGQDEAVVAAVELVSPRNKDRSSARRAFATKAASYLQQVS